MLKPAPATEATADKASEVGNPSHRVRDYFLESAAIKQLAAERCAEDISRAASTIAASLLAGGKLLLCGNGGSAADCQHIAAEFVNLLSRQRQRPAMAALALTTDSSILTACANDFGFAEVFARQVEGLGRAGDVLLGLSTSGSSENVIRALIAAQAAGMATIGMTGEQPELLAGCCDVLIRVPSADTQHIQEVHIAAGHILSELVEAELCGQDLKAKAAD
jgi:D-sedoheptulose 7-phosphate isomerase